MLQKLSDNVARVANSSLARNVAIVASGTAFAQVLGIAFAPFLTRIYGPEPFGILASFTAIVAILAPLASLGYPGAIVLADDDNEAVSIGFLSLVIGVAISAAVAVLVLVLGTWLAELHRFKDIAKFLFLLPIPVFFSVALAVAKQWAIRVGLFSISARVEAVQSLISNSAKLLGGLLLAGPIVLIAVGTCTAMLHAGLLALGLRGSIPSIRGEFTKVARLKDVAVKYRDFPLYRAPQISINSLTLGLPVIALGALFGSASAGFYSIGKLALGLPTMLVGQSVGSVFYPRITQIIKQGRNGRQAIRNATVALAVAGIVPFAVVTAFGPMLFALVFGAEWAVAGDYARWLSIWLYFSLLNRPSVAAIPQLGIQGWFLAFEIASVALRIAGLALGFLYFRSDVAAVALFSGAGALLNIYLVLHVDRMANGGKGGC